jgi:hypothetical protein
MKAERRSGGYQIARLLWMARSIETERHGAAA